MQRERTLDADAVRDFPDRKTGKAILLHHSTGKNVYNYPEEGLPAWFDKHNKNAGAKYLISELWYPKENNMPVHYYKSVCK